MDLSLPTQRQELDRKTLDYLIQAVHRHENNTLSVRDLSMQARAIWMVTAGLVSQEVSDYLEQVADLEREAGNEMKRIFVSPDEVTQIITIEWNLAHPGVRVTRGTPSTFTWKEIRRSDEEPGLREQVIKKTVEALELKGYQEIT